MVKHKQELKNDIMRNIKWLIIVSIIISFSIGCKSESNSNTILLKSDVIQADQTCTLLNKVEYASFKYTSSDLFKTGKVSAPRLILSADTLVFYKEKKYQVKLKHFGVRNSMLGVASLSTGNTTVLLFTKEKQFQYFEVKGTGVFEFMGIKEDKSYFRLSLKDCTTYFSLNLNRPDVLLTEYTVESD
jgi:hypothetical protein